MAIIFMDGFDHYTQLGLPASQTGNSVGPQLQNKWTGDKGSPNYPIGNLTSYRVGPQFARGSGGGLACSAGEGLPAYGIYKTIGGNLSTAIVGAAFYFPNIPGGYGFMGLVDMSTSTTQVYVRGDGAGHLQVCRGNQTVLATSALTVATNTWYYVELKATIHGSAGVVQLRVNGVDWIASTGSLNTQQSANAYATGPILANVGGDQRVDDCYYADTSGSINNDFLGPIKIGTLVPVGAGASTAWTPNGSTNFGSVADMPRPDEDVSFNESSTANDIDTFQMSVLPEASGVPLAIQHCIYAKQDAGAQRQIAPVIRRGGTNYAGTTVNLASSYAYVLEVRETDPSTSAAWTLAGLTAAEFGYKEVS